MSLAYFSLQQNNETFTFHDKFRDKKNFMYNSKILVGNKLQGHQISGIVFNYNLNWKLSKFCSIILYYSILEICRFCFVLPEFALVLNIRVKGVEKRKLRGREKILESKKEGRRVYIVLFCSWWLHYNWTSFNFREIWQNCHFWWYFSIIQSSCCFYFFKGSEYQTNYSYIKIIIILITNLIFL